MTHFAFRRITARLELSSVPRPARGVGPRGFSLIEVLFAGAILVVSLTAVAGVYSSTRESMTTQRDVAAATTIAEAFLEQVVVLPKSSPLLAVGAHTSPERRFRPDGTPGTGAAAPFLLTWTVTDDLPVPGLKQVRVDIAWQRDTRHRVTLTTFRE